MLNFLKVLFGGMAVFMIGLIIKTSLASDMFALNPVVVNEPWFQTTLVDFYFNIAILTAWVFYKERSKVWASIWTVAFICLGSVATCGYLFLQLLKIKDIRNLDAVVLKN